MAGLVKAKYVPAVTGLITGPLVARALGPSARGQAAAVAVFALALPVVLSLGLPTAIGRQAASNPEHRPALLGSARRLAVVLTPGALLLAGLLLYGPLSALDGRAQLVALFALGLAPLGVWSLSVQQILQAEGSLKTLARMWTLPPVVAAGITLFLVATSRLTVASYLLGNLISGVPTLWIARSYARRVRAGTYPLKQLTSFGLRGYAGSLANMTNARLDQMLVVPLLGSAQLGLYAVSVSLASFPLGIGQALASRSFGEVAAAKDRKAEAGRYLRLSVVIALLCCGGIAIIAPVALPALYGTPFKGSLVPLLLLLPGTVCLIILTGTTMSLIVFDRPGLTSVAEVAGLLATLIGLSLFLRRYGVVAAAAVSTASYACTLAVHVGFLRRLGIGPMIPRADDFLYLAGRFRGAGRILHHRGLKSHATG